MGGFDMATPLQRARGILAAENQLSNDVSVEAMLRMELDELLHHTAAQKDKVAALTRRVKRYFQVFAAESAYESDALDKDHDGVLDEVTMEEVRKHCSDEPSLQKLVWEMDDAQLELDTFGELLQQTQAKIQDAAGSRKQSAAQLLALERSVSQAGLDDAVDAARSGMDQEKAEAIKAERDAHAHERLVANNARHGSAPPGGGMDKAASFFGTQGIYPTKVPLEVTDMRTHLPLGYRYHVRSQVEAPPEIQADSKSIFVYQQTMPRAHALAVAHRAAARPGYPYLRSYEWPAE